MKFTLSGQTRYRKIFKWTGIIVILLAALIIIKDSVFWMLIDDEEYYDEYSYIEESYEDGNCNIAKIDLRGFLDIDIYDDGDVSSSDIVRKIENAEESENIKAIILDIDSGGGVAVAGEEISNALSRVTKATIALIRGIGASSAYWSAIGANTIFASANSDVGGIGVTISYLDNVRKNQIEGLNYNSISSGKYKNMMSPDKSLTYEERFLLERDVKIVYENFIKAVAEKRGLDIEKVRALATGATLMGQMALENGLIDQIGDLYAVKQYLGEVLNQEVIICQ